MAVKRRVPPTRGSMNCFKDNLAWTALLRPLLHVFIFAGEHFFHTCVTKYTTGPTASTLIRSVFCYYNKASDAPAERYKPRHFFLCINPQQRVIRTIEIVAFLLCVSVASCGRLGLFLWWWGKAICAATEHLQQAVFFYIQTLNVT